MKKTRDKMLLAIHRQLMPVPRCVWRSQVAAKARHNAARLDFMTTDHHRVRDFAVRELPRFAKPLPPEQFAQDLGLPLERVTAILEDLEHHKTFLFRDPQGAVAWAYPVTVEPTPHRVEFSSGEKLYAA